MPHHQADIIAELERTKARVKTADTVTGLLILLAVAVVYLLAVIVVDQTVTLEHTTRLTLLAVLGVAAAAGLALILLMPTLKRVNDLYAARLIERSAEDLFRNSLISYVQLREDTSVDEGVFEAVAAKAARDLREADVEAAVSRRPMQHAAAALGTALAVLAIFALLSPKSIALSLGRAVGMDLAAPTATQILNVRPPSGTVVDAGDSVEITVDLRGEEPRDVTAVITRDGRPWDRLALEPDGADVPSRWHTTLPALLTDVSFRVFAGDARSREHALRVRDLPAVVDVRTHLAYPAYTQLAPATVAGGNVEAPVGTRVEVVARTNRPISVPLQLVWSAGGATTPLRPSEADDEARGSFTVSRDATYHIRFRDPATGRENRDAIVYRVDALPDRPPAVELAGGAAGTVEVPLGGTAELATRTLDDFGLSDLRLHWQRPPGGGKTRQRTVWTAPEGRAVLSRDMAIAIEAETLGLAAVGDEAALWLTARDRLPAGPQEGRSETIRVVAVEPGGDGQGDAPRDSDSTGDDQPQQGEGTGGADQTEGQSSVEGDVAMTETERREVEQVMEAAEKARQREQTMHSDDSGSQQPAQQTPGEGNAGEGHGDRPPSDGDGTGGGSETPTPGGRPATSAEGAGGQRDPDATVGERGTEFAESGRGDFHRLSDAALVQAAGPVLRQIERDVRRGQVDPALLAELGWSEAELRTWVSRYTDRFGDLAAPGGEASSGAGGDDAAFDPSTVRAVEGGTGSAGSGLTTGRARQDDLPGTVDTGDDATEPSRFTPLIEAYRKSVSEAETE